VQTVRLLVGGLDMGRMKPGAVHLSMATGKTLCGRTQNQVAYRGTDKHRAVTCRTCRRTITDTWGIDLSKKPTNPRKPKLTRDVDQVRVLQGKLGALQRRANEDREYYLLQDALQRFEANRAAGYLGLMNTALLALNRLEDEVMDLVVEALRLHAAKLETEHQASILERRAEYERRKAGPDGKSGPVTS
jgi:hypothetical protein